MLKMARELGDYLIVGVHSDKVVNALHGQNLPIMNLNERLLSVLGCKYVGDVLIDAPYNISKEMVSSLNISVVVKTDIDQFDNPGHKGGSEGSIDCHKEGKEGGSIDGGRDSGREGDREASIEGSMKGSVRGEGSMKGDTKRDKHAISDPYVIPREMGLLTEVPVSSKFKTLTVLDIVDRINMQVSDVCVSMCVYVYVWVYMCVYVCLYLSSSRHSVLDIVDRINMQVSEYGWVCVSSLLFLPRLVLTSSIHIHTYMHMHIYTYIHTHTYIHTYTHTQRDKFAAKFARKKVQEDAYYTDRHNLSN